MADVTKLERAVRIYKSTYDVTDTFFLDVLGIGSRTTWQRLRCGESSFSVKQLHDLAEVLGLGMEELYEMLPEINH